MQSVAVFMALLVASSASTIVRVPSADSALISSQRVGGNFAYSTQEGQAFGVVSPVLSHVTSPVATTYTVQQPTHQVISNVLPTTYTVQNQAQQVVSNVVPTTYTVQNQAQVLSHVQQPATTVVSGSPVATTYTTGAVQQQNVWPVTGQVATTYGSYPYAYTYGGVIAPTTYAAVQSNVVGVEAQKDQVNNVQVQQVVQQPQAVTYAVQQPQTYTVHNQHGESVVATGTPAVATTYAVQQPISVVQQGTPASTFKTVAGASPLGFNTWAYGTGQPWGYNSYNVVV